MAQLEDVQSSSWAELTEKHTACSERTPETEKKVLTSTTETEVQTPASNSKAKAETPKYDLRNKITENRNRRGNVQNSWGTPGRGRRDYHSNRSGYAHSGRGTSPLRSPIHRNSKPTSLMDLDNSRNFRFTNHRFGSSPRGATSPANQQEGPFYQKSSPPKGTRDKWVVTESDSASEGDEPSPRTVFSDSEDEDGTPVLNKIPKDGRPRQSWSRRRLDLPSDNENSDNENGEKLPAIVEEDKVRLARRDKDITYGKNTDAYKKYIEVIPRNKRSNNLKAHPRTPEKYEKCSRRSWDSQVKIWKRRLHAWAENYERGTNPKAADEEKPRSDQASKQKKGEKKSNSTDSDSDDIDLEEDESFLDSVDITFAVAREIEQGVTLEDAK